MNEFIHHLAIQETKKYLCELKEAIEKMEFPPNPLIHKTNENILLLKSELESKIDLDIFDLQGRVVNLSLKINDLKLGIEGKINRAVLIGSCFFLIVLLELAWIIARH